VAGQKELEAVTAELEATKSKLEQLEAGRKELEAVTAELEVVKLKLVEVEAVKQSLEQEIKGLQERIKNQDEQQVFFIFLLLTL
jgi:septal ring factor EnvC (AmiA/AmiB activator)